jgi:hypothetical protein
MLNHLATGDGIKAGIGKGKESSIGVDEQSAVGKPQPTHPFGTPLERFQRQIHADEEISVRGEAGKHPTCPAADFRQDAEALPITQKGFQSEAGFKGGQQEQAEQSVVKGGLLVASVHFPLLPSPFLFRLELG